MAKFYCCTGPQKQIVQSEDYLSAAKKMINMIIRDDLDLSALMYISERGFMSRDSIATPVIPIMKQMDIDMPDDDILADILCQSMGVDRKDIDQKQLNWLLTGKMGD